MVPDVNGHHLPTELPTVAIKQTWPFSSATARRHACARLAVAITASARTAVTRACDTAEIRPVARTMVSLSRLVIVRRRIVVPEEFPLVVASFNGLVRAELIERLTVFVSSAAQIAGVCRRLENRHRQKHSYESYK